MHVRRRKTFHSDLADDNNIDAPRHTGTALVSSYTRRIRFFRRKMPDKVISDVALLTCF